MELKIVKKLNAVLLCILTGLLLAACGGGGSGVGQGTLSTSLTDSSTDEYQAVYVTISRVEVHHDGDGTWEAVASPNKTYNLLELVNGVRETLGITSLDAGHYTQMRLIIGETPGNSLNMHSMMHPHANYNIDQAGVVHEMKVPSGTNTGLKIVNGFDINENQTTELILDFDAMGSVVKSGSSGQYLLKPTVKVLNSADYAIVSGMVTEAGTAPPILLGGTLVTAQVSAPTSLDTKDQVVTEAGTLADENGEYALFLEPGGYNLVASHANYLPSCTAVTLQAVSSSAVDFTLAAATTNPGTISGTVTIANTTGDPYVTIDFRKEVTCVDASNATMITVKSVNIADGGTYTVGLPAGDYQIVTSTFNEDTQTTDVTISTDEMTLLDITF